VSPRRVDRSAGGGLFHPPASADAGAGGDGDEISTILSRVWSKASEIVRARVGERTFHLWFASVTPRSLIKGVFSVSVPNQFIRTWLEDHYRNELRQSVVEALGAHVDVEVRAEAIPPAAAPADADGLEDAPSLDDFVVDPRCELAMRAVRNVIESPGQLYNPLVLCGPEGTGKTHLLRGAVREIAERFPERKALHLGARSFLEQYLFAARKHHLESFRERFSDVDVLAVDDVQELTGRGGTQAEFHALLRQLLASKSQVILSSSAHPKQIEGLDPALQNRLLSGLLVEIPPPAAASLRCILASTARRQGRDVPDDVLDEIVAATSGDARRAALALRKILAYAALVGRRVTLDLVTGAGVGAEIRKDPVDRDRDVVARLVLERFPVRRDLLFSKRKLKAVQTPRRICMHLLRSVAGMSVDEIAALFGDRSEISVTNSLRRIASEMAESPELRGIVDDLARRVRSS
jgi:chromosomal replication initiator protein